MPLMILYPYAKSERVKKRLIREKFWIEILLCLMGISYILTAGNILLKQNEIDSGLVDIFFGSILMNSAILLVYSAFDIYDDKGTEHEPITETNG